MRREILRIRTIDENYIYAQNEAGDTCLIDAARYPGLAPGALAVVSCLECQFIQDGLYLMEPQTLEMIDERVTPPAR